MVRNKKWQHSLTESNSFAPPYLWKRSKRWKLEDAKARLSEVVRLARGHAPQRITVRGGRDAVG